MFSGKTIDELIGMVKVAEANAAAEKALRKIQEAPVVMPASVYCVATYEQQYQKMEREYASAGAA
jgi:hypothetical protein